MLSHLASQSKGLRGTWPVRSNDNIDGYGPPATRDDRPGHPA
jgi:hypothetical protein